MKFFISVACVLAFSTSALAYTVKCSDGKSYAKKIRNTRGLHCGSYGPYKYGAGNYCNLDMRACKRL